MSSQAVFHFHASAALRSLKSVVRSQVHDPIRSDPNMESVFPTKQSKIETFHYSAVVER